MKIIIKQSLIFSIIFLSCSLILSFCGSGAERPEEASDYNSQTDIIVINNSESNNYESENNFYKYCMAFKSGQDEEVLTDCPPKFLSALSNEFILNIMTGERALSNAIFEYSSMTNDPDFDEGLLYQRIGAVYFKLGDYENSYKYINSAVYKGTKNPELYYYKSLLLYYYKKDYSGAEFYLSKLDKTNPFLNWQDILFLKACLKCEKNDFETAYSIFMTAKDVDPGRFYTYYDILPYFFRSNIFGKLGTYVNDSFKYLISLSNSNYRLKAYRELITYNRLKNRETLYIPFNLPENYDYSTNLVYFYSRTYPVIEKSKSQNIISPLQEKRRTVRDMIYSPVYEEYVNEGSESEIFLLEGIVKLTNVRLLPYSYYNSIERIIVISNVILLLSPTNRFEVTTNTDKKDTNKIYMISNAENELYMTNCGYDYYFTTSTFSMDNDKTWDFVTLGITTNNRVIVDLFYPVKRKLEAYSFSLKRHDSAFVIQDINGDNKPELILLDDDVYILNRTNE
jgi:tetratricopeptide (TPR) repeat protein